MKSKPIPQLPKKCTHTQNTQKIPTQIHSHMLTRILTALLTEQRPKKAPFCTQAERNTSGASHLKLLSSRMEI